MGIKVHWNPNSLGLVKLLKGEINCMTTVHFPTVACNIINNINY